MPHHRFVLLLNKLTRLLCIRINVSYFSFNLGFCWERNIWMVIDRNMRAEIDDIASSLLSRIRCTRSKCQFSYPLNNRFWNTWLENFDTSSFIFLFRIILIAVKIHSLTILLLLSHSDIDQELMVPISEVDLVGQSIENISQNQVGSNFRTDESW